MLLFPSLVKEPVIPQVLAQTTSNQIVWYGTMTINLAIQNHAIQIASSGNGPFSFNVGNDGTVSGTGSVTQDVQLSGLYEGYVCSGTGTYQWYYKVGGTADQNSDIANLVFTFTGTTVEGSVNCHLGYNNFVRPMQNTQLANLGTPNIQISLHQGASVDSPFLGAGDLKIDLTRTNSPYSSSTQTQQQSTILPSQAQTTESSTPSNNAQIPSWIKNNAKWWAQGQIEDSEFIKGVQYLIQNRIIVVPTTQINSQKSQEIPYWVKNNAKWWAEGQVGDADFIQGIQFLVQNGIISVSTQSVVIESVTKTISDKGGSVTLSGGSGISVPAGTFTTGQTLTLSLLSSLPNQPPSGLIIGVGPALSISFRSPQTTSFESNLIPQASGQVQPSGSLQVILNAGDISSIPAEQGAAGMADVVDLQGKEYFVGIPENCESSGHCTFDIPPSVASNSQKVILSQVNLNPVITGEVAPRFGPAMWNGQQFIGFPQGFQNSKKTLVLVHGMWSNVQAAYGNCVNDIMTSGKYDQVIGFNYDYTKSITDNGKLLAQFLDSLKNTGSQVDIEAHSEGTVVTLSAMSKTSMSINNVILEGGPIDGTPITSWGLTTIAANVPYLTSVSTYLNSLNSMLESGALYELSPDNPILKNIKADAVKSQPKTNYIRVVGNDPLPIPQSLSNIWPDLDPFNGQPNDWMIPVSSARGDGLPGPSPFYFDKKHFELECDPSVVKDVGVALTGQPKSSGGEQQLAQSSPVMPPSTTISNPTPKAPPLTVQVFSNPTCTVNTYCSTPFVSAFGGQPSYKFQFDKALPMPLSGMGIDPSGNLFGTPTQEGQYDLNVCATDSSGLQACVQTTVNVISSSGRITGTWDGNLQGTLVLRNNGDTCSVSGSIHFGSLHQVGSNEVADGGVSYSLGFSDCTSSPSSSYSYSGNDNLNAQGGQSTFSGTLTDTRNGYFDGNISVQLSNGNLVGVITGSDMFNNYNVQFTATKTSD